MTVIYTRQSRLRMIPDNAASVSGCFCGGFGCERHDGWVDLEVVNCTVVCVHLQMMASFHVSLTGDWGDPEQRGAMFSSVHYEVEADQGRCGRDAEVTVPLGFDAVLRPQGARPTGHARHRT